MINIKREEDNIININNLNVNIDAFNPYAGNYKFDYDGRTYFFKVCNSNEVFNEIFADKLADKLGVDHAHYDYGVLNGNKGALSTSVYGEGEEYVPLFSVANNLCIRTGYANTAETMKRKILPKLCFLKRKEELEKYLNIFAFDIITANSDRHDENLGFIRTKQGNRFRISPIFDNGLICSLPSVRDHIYFQGLSNKGYDNKYNDVVEEFFTTPEYADYLVNMLDKVSLKELCSIIREINEEYPNTFEGDHEFNIYSELNNNLNSIKYLKKEFYRGK